MAHQQGSGRGLLDYTIEDLTHVWTETNDRDRQIVEEIAFGIHSPAYGSGPYSTEDAGGVMQFRGVVFELHAGASSGRAENSCL